MQRLSSPGPSVDSSTGADDSDSDGSDSIEALVGVLSGRRIVALTGAGCSTESGIPDYRGKGRPPARSPIQHDAFVRRADVRQRYWARATAGWERFSQSQPNAAHHALAALEAAGTLNGIITQNVDRLHHAAGSRRVIELHGALAEVTCLSCGTRETRDALHARLLEANPEWLTNWRARAAASAPDGDTELPTTEVEGFRVLDCLVCDGALMPDVVFFGGTVPQEKVADAWSLIDSAEALLIVGSSLAVYSGWRFVRGAAERGLPIAIINLGPTRADDLCQVRIDAKAGDILPRLVSRLRLPLP